MHVQLRSTLWCKFGGYSAVLRMMHCNLAVLSAECCLPIQVAFVKLKIPVTERQLRRVADALMRVIHNGAKTQPKNVGVNVHNILQPEKMARYGTSLHHSVYNGKSLTLM